MPTLQGASMKNTKKSFMQQYGSLFEDITKVMDQTTVLLNVQGIGEKIQKMAEDLAIIQAKDVMGLLDSITTNFGPEVSQQFNAAATEAVSSLIVAIQSTKSGIDQELQRMKMSLSGGGTSDMDMMGNEQPPAPDMGGGDMGEPNMEPDGGDELPDMPPPDAMGGADNFAGRARKEGAQRRGKVIENTVAEDFLGGDSRPAPTTTPPGDHKGPHFDTNLDNIKNWHGGAGQTAHEIAALIHSSSLSADERKRLGNVLSHFCSVAHDPSHWGIDTETKLISSLEARGIFDHKTPAVRQIIAKMRELVGQICVTHKTMTESAILKLKRSDNPDALIFETFRKKLVETHDAQTAAIKTSRMFAIDLDDVICIIREAAEEAKKCSACKGTGKMKGKDCFVCKGSGKAPEKKSKVKESGLAAHERHNLRDTTDDKKECPDCNGKGRIRGPSPGYKAGGGPMEGAPKSHRCDACKGTGKVDAKKPVKEAPKEEFYRIRGLDKTTDKIENKLAKKLGKEEPEKEPVKEFKLDTPKSAVGMFKGKDLDDLESQAAGLRKRIVAADKKDKAHASLTKELERVNFAIRAKKSKGGKGWHKSVKEEALLKDVPMFPIGATSNTSGGTAAPATSVQTSDPDGVVSPTPSSGTPNRLPSSKSPGMPANNVSSSMVKPSGSQSAATVKMNNEIKQQAAVTGQPQQKPATTQNSQQSMMNNPMVPPNEKDDDAEIPNPEQPSMVPNRQVRKPAPGVTMPGRQVR